MKKPWRKLIFLLLLVCLAVAYDVGRQGIQAQHQVDTDPWPIAEPSLPRRGQPLPGQGYPWQPVQQTLGTRNTTTLEPPTGLDLDVTFISRAPMYKSYCVEYSDGIPSLCPGTENEKRWPDPGEVVTFTAHIVNKGTLAGSSFDYKWYIDEVEMASGTMPGLAPGEEAIVNFQWAWAHTMVGERVVDDHTIRFSVDPDNLISETYLSNNTLVDRTNALGFRIAITPAMVEAYNTPLNPSFPFSAEDWLQRQIAAMNWALENAVYPTTPAGATERVRINTIEITDSSPINDGSTDGGWFVDADYREVSGWYDPETDVDWALVHELSHQVGLIDLYQSNVSVDSVHVLDSYGNPTNFAFTWPNGGIMAGGDITPHTDPHLYSSHSAGGISSTKGYRRGYYGEYQYDIPEENYLLILDNVGSPAADVTVALYQRTGPADWIGSLAVDNEPEIIGTTDENGRILLTNQSANGGTTTNTGHTLRDNPFGVIDVVGRRNRFLYRLSKDNHEEFGWLDVTAFNLAYWQRETLSHTVTIPAHVPFNSAFSAPEITSIQVTGNQATLCWQYPIAAALADYRVYRAGPPTYAYKRVTELLADSCFLDDFSGGNRIYAVTAVNEYDNESGFSNFVWAPRLINPAAVGQMTDGTHVILDPQNGYALLRQEANGRYLQTIGSPHYHLEFSQYLAVDELDRLIISHPGDYYSSRHSIRIADRNAMPLLEIGSRGSSPGQFETPTGVAVWGQPSTIAGPHEVDNQTLLLLHFDGSYIGAQGQSGNFSGTSFDTGMYEQGVQIDTSDTLTYASAGNLNRTTGAIEFWLRPNWDGNDFNSYTFFEVGDSWFNRMRIMKDGANNLRFMLWNNTTETGVATNVAHWQAGEWHHIAATWEDTTIALYVDGLQVGLLENTFVPDTLADTIYIGSTLWHDQQADAVIDEFRIGDIPRVGNSDSSNFRILVADSGNHRVQAFNESGEFITTFGTFGSGPGQFNNPQGLAVDNAGRVLIVDQNNNRLQVLSFDGAHFDFVQTITADFNRPTAVSSFSDQRIVVADTANNMIKLLGRHGNLLATYTAPNDAYSGQFNNPQGVAVNNDQLIVVADTGNKRVVTIEVESAASKDMVYISSNSGGVSGDVTFADEDILAYDTVKGSWSLLFDGSDVGLGVTDVDAVSVMNDGSILMSFAQPIRLSGLGKVDDSDIVRFIPVSLGADTAGSFELVFDGSDAGLTRPGEDVDAFSFAPDGRLIISTNAAFQVLQTGGGQINGADEDLIVFNGTMGDQIRGTWEMYFDGSDVMSFTGDVWGIWLDTTTNDIYLSLQDAFAVVGVAGDAQDIFVCHPTSLGTTTACTFDPELYFNGADAGFGGNRIDAFSIDN